MLTRFLENLIGRFDGPLTFRLILQPIMAVALAFRAGLSDAREGRPAYFWAVFDSPGRRRELLLDAWRDVRKVFLLAVVLDVIYQVIVVRWVYPAETLMVAIVLALLPYVAVRGPVNRLARGRRA